MQSRPTSLAPTSSSQDRVLTNRPLPAPISNVCPNAACAEPSLPGTHLDFIITRHLHDNSLRPEKKEFKNFVLLKIDIGSRHCGSDFLALKNSRLIKEERFNLYIDRTERDWKMDNNEIIKDLLKCGVSRNDIDILLKKSSIRKISVSRVFITSFLGLYTGTATLIGIYFFFIHSMNQKEMIAFTCIYIPILFIMYFFTPSFKVFFWSLKVLLKLKGR